MIIGDARARDRKRFVLSENVENRFSLSLGRVSAADAARSEIEQENAGDLSPENCRVMYRGRARKFRFLAMLDDSTTRSPCCDAASLLRISFQFPGMQTAVD